MIELLSVAAMRESDAATIRGGISGKELMYRAGVGIFESVRWHGNVAIVCGSGNNAGDGYVLAILLSEKKIPCTLFSCPSASPRTENIISTVPAPLGSRQSSAPTHPIFRAIP
jgi:NAD(P)H-hydrate repair Nnr-like enzyme with NAD(P)H-hydrate epimerase domain